MKKFVLLISAISVVFVVIIACCCIYFINPSSTDIFNKSVQSIAELKSYDEIAGENYGTAVCIDDSGKFVTCAHVVTYTLLGIDYTYDEYYIRFADEDEYREVQLIKYDSEQDLALLQFSDFYVKAIQIGDSDNITFGETVYAIGNGSNYGISITSGIISIPKVNIEYDGTTMEVIRCDVTVVAGNSGGALLNSKGKLIGIPAFRTKDSVGNVIYGIAYCIPINTVMNYIA